MAWIRLDDGFPDHPKLAKVGPCGLALQVRMLCYAGRHLTDGFVPSREVQLASSDLPRPRTTGKLHWPCKMVEAGLWKVVPHGYQIHDYLRYNPSKSDVLALRQKKQAAGQAGGQASAQARAQAESKQRLKQNPTPLPHPLPQREEKNPEGGTPPVDKTGGNGMQATKPTDRFPGSGLTRVGEEIAHAMRKHGLTED